MLRLGGLIKEVEEGVVHHIDEELRAAGVGRAGVRHGERTRNIAQLGAVGLTKLIRNAALSVAGDLAFSRDVELRAWGRASGARLLGLRITAVRAAELVHEVFNNSVEVEIVVETLFSEVNEVVSSEGPTEVI